MSNQKVDNDNKTGQKLTLDKLFVAASLPSKFALSAGCAVLILGLFFLLPLASSHRSSWATGEMSRVHSMFAENCSACHSGSFEKVQDKACLNCHTMSTHGAGLVKGDQRSGLFTHSCADCHHEHDGQSSENLFTRESELCTACHARALPNNMPVVSSWAKHPEFRVSVPATGGEIVRVKVNADPATKDMSGLKLNHKIHLKPGLRGPDGAVTLKCNDCHEPLAGARAIASVNMERHCKSCHPIEFDNRFPKKEVPHADADVVYKFLYAEYAKLLLEGENISSSTSARNLPGHEVRGPSQAGASFSKIEVEQEARRAEKELFSRTACFMCHDVTEKSQAINELNAQQLSRYQVQSPVLPESWMPASFFSHLAHEAVLCDECHKGVHQSVATSDVLMPAKQDCLTCHIKSGHSDSASSDCITCHSYHDSVQVDFARKRRIQEIVKELRVP